MKFGKIKIGMNLSGYGGFWGRLFVAREGDKNGRYLCPFYNKKSIKKYIKTKKPKPILLFTTYWVWQFYLSIHTTDFLMDQAKLNSVCGVYPNRIKLTGMAFND